MVQGGREPSSPEDQPVCAPRQGHSEDFWNIPVLPVSRGREGQAPLFLEACRVPGALPVATSSPTLPTAL